MPAFATHTALPRYLRVEQERIEAIAREAGLDFFPVIFEMLSYDQMNEIAAYGGFPSRYPHWRFGMEFERLSRSHEYGLSKIYEMVINNNPSIAYLLEGNSLTDQKLVMCHVLGHVDFFKNNFAFRATDLDAAGPVLDPVSRRGPGYAPNRRWIDRIANHAAAVRRIVERYGVGRVEELIDQCLSLENLIDPHSAFAVRRRAVEDDDEPRAVEVPRLRAKDYMESFINPAEYLEAERTRLEAARAAAQRRFPREPDQDVLRFLLEAAPLERWERTVLGVIRDEAYYFAPQAQTKIMNEGWASYWHSRLMTERVLDWSEVIDSAEDNAGVMATHGRALNPYKLGAELFRSVEERWDRGQFGREWEACDDLDALRHWDLRLGLGRQKIFEVRALYNDVTFIDEFLTPEFAAERRLFAFDWSRRNERYEVSSRDFAVIKGKLLAGLANAGHPIVRVLDANYENKGELLLEHDHQGVDLRQDYARDTLRALVRIWKRPVAIATVVEQRPVIVRFDGQVHEVRDGSA